LLILQVRGLSYVKRRRVFTVNWKGKAAVFLENIVIGPGSTGTSDGRNLF
jgi:hypothetical protein